VCLWSLLLTLAMHTWDLLNLRSCKGISGTEAEYQRHPSFGKVASLWWKCVPTFTSMVLSTTEEQYDVQHGTLLYVLFGISVVDLVIWNMCSFTFTHPRYVEAPIGRERSYRLTRNASDALIIADLGTS
jgi:hypothetical protein